MLPRLRFVFVAALIAALPWILLGSGIVTTAQNTPISEHVRPSQGVTVTAGDLRDAQRMHSLAFVRRSRELERLREMASAPLSEWIAAPSGAAASDSTAESDDHATRQEEPAPASPPALEPQTVASLPEEPAAANEPAVALAAPPSVEERIVSLSPAAAPDAAPSTAPAAVQDLAVEAEPPLSRMDWSKAVPPLPRARAGVEHQKPTARRQRIKRHRQLSQHQVPQRQIPPTNQLSPNLFGLQPDPFAGPPATATLTNPGFNADSVLY